MLLADGVSIAEVARRLGHSKVSTTLDYYAHALPEDADQAAERFERRVAAYAAIGKQLGKQTPKPLPFTTHLKTPNPLRDGRLRNVPRARIELATPGFSDLCSTN
jgi:hypothetical protein